MVSLRKIILIGSGGAGKSTMARELGKKLNVQVHHLDSLFWKPNWVGVSRDEQIKVQHELVKKRGMDYRWQLWWDHGYKA